MNKEKLQDIIKKSQRQFLVENNEQITHTSRNLIAYINKGEEEDYEVLYQFYHRIRGTSGTLGLKDIEEVAGKIEELMLTEKESLTEEYAHICTLVKGTGKLLELIEYRLSEVLMEVTQTLHEESVQGETRLYSGKLLVVDDDVSMLNYLEEVLKHQGFEVYLTSSPDEALDYLKNGDIDLALVDVVMPEKSGLDIYQEILKINSRMPIIFMTGLNSRDVRLEALNQGAEFYIQKPVDPKALIARISGLINKKKINDSRQNRDELTQAFTRKQFLRSFAQEKHRFDERGTPFSVAFMDLDYFKTINDTQGHLFGDQVLKRFVDGIRTHLTDGSEVFRFGGDEFLVLFPGLKGEQAKEVVENIRETINSRPLMLKDGSEQMGIRFSAGIAEFSEQVSSKTQLLEKADQSLYIAKEKGKNQTVLEGESEEVPGNNILVVDDETLLANIIKTRLGYLGYTVEHAKDGQEALDKLSLGQYDLVLLDIMLPKVTGIEVLKHMKDRKLNDRAKVMMISGKHSEASVMECLRLGADDFFEKPFSLEVLEHKIKKILTS
ncbi:diguanylate cyclase/phosphodiesterase (GGDEF & EAL domain) with PAS/PAC sensor(s) [Alkalibacterium sp. AK22]|uniref:response regulator n=1 Tax=Alkalibacterium sp. AK22 TaxID=1229520 RepID=UPI00044F5622|nr:response regulator [Alkalibacterium sp. AK22]EXJ23246.1 diguanylate cyclase/phosphodiesterase (GGDEF & EAL domain) with PAS/PAC sensor(s) [Alkalibacterium sp. AK22]